MAEQGKKTKPKYILTKPETVVFDYTNNWDETVQNTVKTKRS